MFLLKLPFTEKPSAEPPSIPETTSVSTDSDDSCVMLSKKPVDLRLYSAIFRQPKLGHALSVRQTSVHSMSYSNQFFINRVRSSHGLQELHRSRDLDHLARHHAERMALRETIFHSCHTVKELKSHLGSLFVGENVQRGKTIRDIHDNMLACRAQRQNVLSLQFQELGIGTCKGTDGMLYMVQLFRAADETRDACDVGPRVGKSIWK
ncbi:hypothetical protein MPSEU_000161900 [Mayamaea pseudoterrestris]|nr:hypothetical protein MPSEU_000161900 [Mayamaea pseudoterrestris]